MKSASELRARGWTVPTPKKVETTEAYRIVRLPRGQTRVLKENFTTHLRGPSVARPTSGLGYLPTRAWMDVNASRYGIVRHRGSI